MSQEVIRHPFASWAEDGLGVSRRKVFGSDVPHYAYGFDPGGSKELTPSGDAAIVTSPALYFDHEVDAGPHDEWTVNGLRYHQDGEAAKWEPPWGGRTETIVRLERRTG